MSQDPDDIMAGFDADVIPAIQHLRDMCTKYRLHWLLGIQVCRDTANGREYGVAVTHNDDNDADGPLYSEQLAASLAVLHSQDAAKFLLTAMGIVESLATAQDSVDGYFDSVLLSADNLPTN